MYYIQGRIPITGRLTGDALEEGWVLTGIYSNKALAFQACIDARDFVATLPIDPIGEEEVDLDVYFPHDDEEDDDDE